MKKKMTWFKHHNTASDGQTIQTLLARGDHESVALFWILIEICSRWSEQDDAGIQIGRVEIPLQVIATKMHFKPSRTWRVMERISSVSQIDMEKKPNGNVSFLVRNFSELQERRGGFASQKNTKEPTEVRSKRKEKEENKAGTASRAGLVGADSNSKTSTREKLFVEIRELVRQHWKGDKGNHAEGCRTLAKLVKPNELTPLVEALRNFMAYKARSGEYIPHLKTWAKNWRDWVNGGEAAKGVGAAPMKEITLKPGESAIDLIRGFDEQP